MDFLFKLAIKHEITFRFWGIVLFMFENPVTAPHKTIMICVHFCRYLRINKIKGENSELHCDCVALVLVISKVLITF